VLEWFFGVLFTVELVLKVAAMGLDFFREAWNWMDSVIVLFWIIGTAGGAFVPIDIMLLRLVRLVRLLRLLRLAKTIQGFDALYVMTTSIKGSLSALLWSTVVLMLIQMMIAMILRAGLESFVLDESNPQAHREQVYRYFGTFSKAMLSMSELTLANWIPIGRTLTERVNEWFLLFVLTHKFLIGHAVLMVLTGVFLQETFKVASNDNFIMMKQRAREIKTHTKKMQKLFAAADEDDSGYLDKNEFMQVVQERTVRMWLAAMGLQVSDAGTLFDLIDDGDGQLTAEELVRGVSRVKGTARAIDLAVVMREQRAHQAEMQSILAEIAELRQHVVPSPCLESTKTMSDLSSTEDANA